MTALPLPGGSRGNFTEPGNSGNLTSNGTSTTTDNSTEPLHTNGASPIRLDFGLGPFLPSWKKPSPGHSSGIRRGERSRPHSQTYDEPQLRTLIESYSSAVARLLGDARAVSTALAMTVSPFLFLVLLLDQLL